MIDFNQCNPTLLSEYIEGRQVKNLRELFDEMNIVDLAEIVAELSVEEIMFLFKILRKEISAQLFTYLPNDVKAQMITSFTSGQIKSMIETLYTDDLVDFLQDLPANLIRQILKEADHEQRSEINLLLSYPSYSAGSLMSLDFVELKAEDSVKQAITKIKRQGKDAETIQVCFVVDEQRNLVGSVSLRTILFEDDETIIKDIMDIDVIYATTHDDQEVVAKLMQRYDMTVAPIVNDELRLIGIVTIDDMIDVLEDEVTEDIQKMAAILPLEGSYLESSLSDIVKSRIAWLLVLMVSATLTGSIIGGFEEQIELNPALSFFIPMIMSTAGNAGSQASTMVIRGIVVDQLDTKDIFKVLSKELMVALLSGSVIFMANMIRVLVFMPNTDLSVHVVVSTTLFIMMVISKMVGGLLPLLAKKLNQDPAAMAAPLITTIVDALAMLIYFTLALLWLGI
ncbi:MAG: magnesium transporter [Erysipelotrichia bacterium]|jgi:magnesium transporter|nr:magnesium transporter [Erysipelotrichia bacterium]